MKASDCAATFLRGLADEIEAERLALEPVADARAAADLDEH